MEVRSPTQMQELTHTNRSPTQELTGMQELTTIPQKSCDRKVSELVKRVRALKVHLLLIQHLKKQMPAIMFKQSAEAKIIDEMPEHFLKVRHA